MAALICLGAAHVPALAVKGDALNAPDFSAFIEGLRPDAKARGISEATFNAATRDITFDQSVIDASIEQPEFARALWTYLDSAISDLRVANGKARLAEMKPVLDVIEQKYGVDRHVLVAIWGIESAYGAAKGGKDVIRSLATLAFAGERADFGRAQLLDALEILEQGEVTPERMVGSWAGAMGHTQFIPGAYKSYAVDHDGDGKRDIWGNAADALASTANYLKSHGWQSGEPWFQEVTIPEGFDYTETAEDIIRPLSDWARLGIARTHGRKFEKPERRASMLMPAGKGGPALLVFANVHAIMKYNKAMAYVVAVGHLAQRLRGEPAFEAHWPRGDRPLSRVGREELQKLLTDSGFDPGGVDGLIGPKTRRAVRAWQSSVSATPDGYADVSLLERLRAGTKSQ